MKTSTTIVAALVTIVSCVVPTLADDSKKVTTGKVVLVTPKDDQSLVWLYDLDTVNKLRITTDEDPTEQRVPSLSYNGNKELTILYTEQDSPGRKDRVDMALIQGNVRDEITSFKYIVVSHSYGDKIGLRIMYMTMADAKV